MGWAVAVCDLEPVAARLGSPIATVGRQGRTARLSGLAESLAEPCLPFFIERDPAHATPRQGAAIGWIELSGDRRRVEHWLGGAELPLRLVDGEPRVRAVGIGDRELRTG
jgi:hypothetical protein